MIYLFKNADGESYSITFDGSVLTEELKNEAIQVESLPEGHGILKRNKNGEFYFEEVEQVVITPPEPVEPKPTLEELQTQTLLNTEYLVTMSELSNVKGE